MIKNKPKVYIAMPCYDTMKVETCVSILNTYAVLAKSGITCAFKSVKSSFRKCHAEIFTYFKTF